MPIAGVRQTKGNSVIAHLIVLGRNELARASIVASLGHLTDFSVEPCADPAAHAGAGPDLLIVNDGDTAPDPWLGNQLSAVGARWPGANTIVLTGQSRRKWQLCRSFRVRACLPVTVDIEQVVAVFHLVAANFIIYPRDLLIESEVASGLLDREERVSDDRASNNGFDIGAAHEKPRKHAGTVP